MYVFMALVLLVRPRGLLGERWERFEWSRSSRTPPPPPRHARMAGWKRSARRAWRASGRMLMRERRTGRIGALLHHPVLWVALVLAALSAFWRLTGAPQGLITEIAIYTLYGAGVNLLVGYTGLVPFGASVFFGCATYATAISMLRFLNNDILWVQLVCVFFFFFFSHHILAGLRR